MLFGSCKIHYNSLEFTKLLTSVTLKKNPIIEKNLCIIREYCIIIEYCKNGKNNYKK